MVMICLFKIAIFERLPAGLLSCFTELTAIFPASFQGAVWLHSPGHRNSFIASDAVYAAVGPLQCSAAFTQAELGLLSGFCICSSFEVAQFTGSFCYLGGGLSLECPSPHRLQTSPSSSLQPSPLLCFTGLLPAQNPSTIYCLQLETALHHIKYIFMVNSQLGPCGAGVPNSSESSEWILKETAQIPIQVRESLAFGPGSRSWGLFLLLLLLKTVQVKLTGLTPFFSPYN